MKTRTVLASLSTTTFLGSQLLLSATPSHALPAWSTYCGPESNPGASVLWNGLLYPWSRLFDSSCQKHDEGYTKVNNGERGWTQTRVDREFKNDMNRQCNQNWQSALGLTGTAGEIGTAMAQIFSLGTFGIAMKAWCNGAAESNYQMVTTFGEDVGAVSGFPSINVTNAKIRRVYNRWSDDEIDVTFTVANNSNVNIEVDAVLMKRGKGFRHLVKPSFLGTISSAFNSDIIDAVPNTHEKDLRPGQQWSEKVTTDGFWASQEDLSSTVNVFIRADLYSDGNNFTAPFVPMAWLQCPKPGKPGSADCTVKYRFSDGWSNTSVSQKANDWLASVRRSNWPRPRRGQGQGQPSRQDTACANPKTAMGVWSFKDPARNKYARGGVTAEGRKDLVGAFATRVTNPNRAWETFKLYSIPGVRGGRRLQNTIDGRWLETVNATNTLLLHGPVRSCSTSNKDMQWRVVNVPGRRGVYKLQSLRTNKFVKVSGNGLLKANASQSQATPFSWSKY